MNAQRTQQRAGYSPRAGAPRRGRLARLARHSETCTRSLHTPHHRAVHWDADMVYVSHAYVHASYSTASCAINCTCLLQSEVQHTMSVQYSGVSNKHQVKGKP